MEKDMKKRGGFTVVELLVSVSVFIILAIIAVGAFINGLRSQRSLTQIMAMNNNLGIVLEQMTREFRTGYFDDTPDRINPSARAPAPNPGECNTSLTFINGQETDIRGDISLTTYNLSGDRITRSTSDGGGGILTGEDVEVQDLCFYLQWVPENPMDQYCNPPRLTVRMRVKPKSEERDIAARYIQTTVSSRILPREIESDPLQCKDRNPE